MISGDALQHCLIWATRGRTWGFRFLLDAGLADPLTVYEQAFAGLPEDRSVVLNDGESAILRFPDPAGHKDHSGRVIPHEVIVLGSAATLIDSLESGIALVWALLGETYSELWDAERPPTVSHVEDLMAHLTGRGTGTGQAF